MIHEWQVVLFRFPYTDQSPGKLRPALVLRRLPGPYEDWLICMVSSQVSRPTPGLDERIEPGDLDFGASGLMTSSVIRLARLAVVERQLLLGSVGRVADERLVRLREKLAAWILGA